MEKGKEDPPCIEPLGTSCLQGNGRAGSHWGGGARKPATHAPGVEVVEQQVGDGDGGDDPQALKAQPEQPDDDARQEGGRGVRV